MPAPAGNETHRMLHAFAQSRRGGFIAEPAALRLRRKNGAKIMRQRLALATAGFVELGEKKTRTEKIRIDFRGALKVCARLLRIACGDAREAEIFPQFRIVRLDCGGTLEQFDGAMRLPCQQRALRGIVERLQLRRFQFEYARECGIGFVQTILRSSVARNLQRRVQ